jgi:eukaryotic-like serine/threonine-protein kinase
MEAPMMNKRHVFHISSLAWSPDGQRIASAGAKRVEVVDAATGKRFFTYMGHTAHVKAVSWSPDPPTGGHGGGRIASGSHTGEVQVWDAATRAHLLTYSGQPWRTSNGYISGALNCLAWSPDGTRIASGSDTTHLWESATGNRLLTIPAPAMSLAWSPDGARLALACGGIQVYDVASGRLLTTCGDKFSGMTSLAWSPDGQRLLVGGLYGMLYMCDAMTGNVLLAWHGGGHNVHAVAWSPDGAHLASAGDFDGAVHLWDAATASHVGDYRGHTGGWVFALAWSPGGQRIASGGWDRTLQVWEPVFGAASTPVSGSGIDPILLSVLQIRAQISR